MVETSKIKDIECNDQKSFRNLVAKETVISLQ